MPIENPIHKDEQDGKWYFFDECWAEREGPYETEEECREALNKYCKDVLNMNYPKSHEIK